MDFQNHKNTSQFTDLELKFGNIFIKNNFTDPYQSNSNILSFKNLNSFSIENNIDTTSNSLITKNNVFINYFQVDLFSKNNKKCKNKEIKAKLNRMINILSKIFKNLNLVESDFNLDKNELKIIYFILKKKFFKKSACLIKTDFKIQNLKNLVKMIQNLTSNKRVEEMNKFIFKLTLKKLKNNFFLIKNLNFTKENENKFYEYYFKESSNFDKNFDLKFIRHYFESKTKYNHSFLKVIFKNEKFKEDFFHYIKNYFFSNYLELIERKFKKIFQSLKKNMKKNDLNQAIEFFLRNFINKKRIKFPWYSNEIKIAILHFQKLITTLLRN